MNRDTEIQIIKACQSGDLKKFEELYSAYVRKIYDFVYYKTHHKETAEDLTSLIFLKALSNMKKYQSEIGSFSAWLYRIARNSIIDHYRSKKDDKNICDIYDLSAKEDLPRDFDLKEKLARVNEYLSKLSPEQRDIVILRVWSGLSYSEIAEITGKTEGNCKMIFSRTMVKLRKEIPLVLLLLYQAFL